MRRRLEEDTEVTAVITDGVSNGKSSRLENPLVPVDTGPDDRLTLFRASKWVMLASS